MPETHTPFFMQEAEAHYGHAFEVETPAELDRAMGKWAALHEADRSFILAHLLYLNLKAHVVTQRLTIQSRDLIDEVAEHVALGVEQVLPTEGEQPASRGPQEPEFPDLEELRAQPSPAEPPRAEAPRAEAPRAAPDANQGGAL